MKWKHDTDAPPPSTIFVPMPLLHALPIFIKKPDENKAKLQPANLGSVNAPPKSIPNDAIYSHLGIWYLVSNKKEPEWLT